MPKLPTYRNETFPNAGSTAELASATQRNAYNLGQTIEGGWKDLGRGVSKAQGDYEQRKAQEKALAEQEDVANLTVAYAIQNAKAIVEFKKGLSEAEPGDTNFAQRYMDGLAPQYDGLKAQAKTAAGRRYAAKANAEAYSSMWVSTAADQANLNADFAVQQFETISNAYSQSALDDPSNWKAYEEQMNSAVEAQIEVGAMPAKEAIKLRNLNTETLVKSAIKGYIRRDPEGALKAIAAGDFTGKLDGEELFALENMAKEKIKSNLADEKATKVEARQVAQQKADDEAVELLKFKTDARGKVIVPGNFNDLVDVWAEQNPDGSSVSEVIALKNYAAAEVSRGDDNVPIDLSTYENFMTKGADGTLTREDVLNARGRDKLTKQHFDFFLNWVGSDAEESKDITKFADSIKRYKGFIVKSAMGNLADTVGEQLWVDYSVDMQEQLPKLKALGWTQVQIDAYAAENVEKYKLTPADSRKFNELISKRGSLSPNLAPNIDPIDPAKMKKPDAKAIMGDPPPTKKRADAGDVPIIYQNEGKTRNLALVPELERKLQDGVGAIFGEGYSVGISSGGQAPKGYPFMGKVAHGTTGTDRHDFGEAADIRVIGPDGKQVTDRKKLDQLAAYWLKNEYGSVGKYMAGGEIHLDIKTKKKLKPGQALAWSY